MALPTVAKWQNQTSRFLHSRDNPLIGDIDTLLTAYHSGGKSDIQLQKILVLMLYICTEWLVNKKSNNWRRPYVGKLVNAIEAELRTPAMMNAVADRVGASGLTMKEDPIELLQPKDLSAKYQLAGTTNFHRVNAHTAKGFVASFANRNDVTGYAAKLQRVIPADYVDELKILAVGNAEQLHDMKRNLAYLSRADRKSRCLVLGAHNCFHLDDSLQVYSSPDSVPDLCVIDQFEQIYVSSIKAAGKFHHSSFLSGKPVLFAGELRVAQGVINYINSMSGHYRPSTQDLLKAVTLLRDKYGCDLTRIRVEDGAANTKWPTAAEFLKCGGNPKLMTKSTTSKVTARESI